MNLSSLFSFFRGEVDDFENNRSLKNSIVRTDFMIENTFSYLVGDLYQFETTKAMNKKENDAFISMKQTVDEFKGSFADSVQSLCGEVGVISEDTIGSILLGVSNEVFSEGITWSRILAFFVFIGELTKTCISNNKPIGIVHVIYESFSELVKDKLESWIQDHGGWEGISELSGGIKQENLEVSNQSWVRSFFHTTVRVIGTLASVANTANNGFTEYSID